MSFIKNETRLLLFSNSNTLSTYVQGNNVDYVEEPIVYESRKFT